MRTIRYLMEDEAEALRLDLKTDPAAAERQARWAGISPGMRVADIGCGSGKVSAVLHDIVQPGGTVVGIDGSSKRAAYARDNHPRPNLTFEVRDVRAALTDLGTFDFVWCRFFLEYYREEAFEIVRNISTLLKPGGIICLVDLDYNCLTYFGLPPRLEKTMTAVVRLLQEKANFDPYAGRKLYTTLHRLGFEKMDVQVSAHHLIFGELREADHYNWMKKLEVISKKIDYGFEGYGSHAEFVEEFEAFFRDPSRFIYTPLIACRGVRR